jgi:hypothetical protein
MIKALGSITSERKKKKGKEGGRKKRNKAVLG